jgi:hypothetical protein
MKYPYVFAALVLAWAIPLHAQSAASSQNAPATGQQAKAPPLTPAEHAVLDPLFKQESSEIHAVRVDPTLTKAQILAKTAAIHKHYYHLRRAALQKLRGK